MVGFFKSDSCWPKIAGHTFSIHIHGKYIFSCVGELGRLVYRCACSVTLLFIIENKQKKNNWHLVLYFTQTQCRSPQVTSGIKHCNENKPLFCSAKFCWSSAIKYAMHQTIKERYKQADTCRCCPRYQEVSLEHDTKGGTAIKEWCPGGS